MKKFIIKLYDLTNHYIKLEIIHLKINQSLRNFIKINYCIFLLYLLIYELFIYIKLTNLYK